MDKKLRLNREDCLLLGPDGQVIRELLGHESLATTGMYLDLATGHKRKVYDKAHPRDHMDD